jgi:hypothetical protein
MYTIHDSADVGCPVRAFADDRDPAAAHRRAEALGIPEARRILLSEPRVSVDEALCGALDARQLRLDLDAEREQREGAEMDLLDAERRVEGWRSECRTREAELKEATARVRHLEAVIMPMRLW